MNKTFTFSSNVFFSFLFITLALLFANRVSANSKEAISSGTWNTASIWSPAGVPAAGDDVTIDPGVTVTLITSPTCLSLTINGELNVLTRAITITGDVTNNDSLSCTTGVITCKGNFNNYGTFFAGTGNVIFSGNSSYSINGNDPVFYNLNLNSATLVLNATPAGTLTVSNIFTLANGTFLSPGIMNLNLVALNGGTFNGAGSGVLVTGNWTNNGGAFIPATTGLGSVNFTANSTIGGTAITTFDDVTINDGVTTTLSHAVSFATITVGNGTSGMLTAAANTITAGTVNINGGGSITCTTGIINCNGDWNNSGTFAAGTGTVNFLAGDGNNHSINGNDPLFYNLNINLSQPALTLDAYYGIGTLSVTNNFTLTNGIFNASGIFDLKNIIINGGTLNPSSQTNVSGNWTNNDNAAAIAVGQGQTVTFNGSGAQSIGGVAAQNFYDIEIGNTGTLTISIDSLTVLDNLTIDAGATLAAGASIINIGYQWINNGGTFLPATGTVNFNNQGYYNNISGTALDQTFNNITITMGGWDLDASGLNSLTINSNLTMLGAGGLWPPGSFNGYSQGAQTITVAGNVLLSGGGQFFAPLFLYVGGNWTNNSDGGSRGTFDTYDDGYYATDAIIFNGTGNQIIGGSATPQNFQDITVNKSSGTLSVAAGVTSLLINDNFTLTKGTFNACATTGSTVGISPSTSVDAFVLTAGTFNGGPDTVTINGQVTQAAGTVTSTGTFVYQNLDQQGVATGTYNNLRFDDNNKALLPGTIFISGVFTPGAGTNQTTTGNTMNFNGSTSQVIPPFNYPNDNGIDGYNNLTFSTVKVFGGDISVSGVLTFTGAGNITLGLNNLTMGYTGSITGPFSSSQMIIIDSTGRLLKKFNTGSQSFLYPLGTVVAATDHYTPVTLAINNVTTAGEVGVTFTPTVDPNAVAPPPPATDWLKKYWVFDDNGSGIGFDYYSATVTYLATDYNANLQAAQEPTMGATVWNNGLWTDFDLSSRTTKNPTVAGITTLGDLTFLACASLTKTSDPATAYYCLSAGGAVTFTVGTSGVASGYQWYENGVSLGADNGVYSGTQTATLTITGPDVSFDGNTYYCAVTAACTGSFISNAATLHVVDGTPPTYTLSVSPSPNWVWDSTIAYGAGRWTDAMCDGAVLTFTSNATGTLPVTFTWVDFMSFGIFSTTTNTLVIDTKNDSTLDGQPWTADRGWGPGVSDILVEAGNACGTATQSAQDIWILVATQPVAPTLLTKSPDQNSICSGQVVSATFNDGTGGVCSNGLAYNDTTDEPRLAACGDDYVLIIDGGTPVPYVPGSNAATAGATSSVVIQGERTGNTNFLDCSGTGYITLASWTVNPSSVKINPASSSICKGDTGTSLTASGATTFSWAPSAGLNATTGAVVTANPTVATTYTVTGTSGTCGTDTTANATITLIYCGPSKYNVTYNSGISANPAVTVCAGITNIGLSNGDTGVAYKLLESGTVVSTVTPSVAGAFNFSYTPLGGKTYTITGTDTSNLTTTMNGAVTVSSLPVVTTVDTASTCSGIKTDIKLKANMASSFSWTLGNITGGITGAVMGSDSVINQSLTNTGSTAGSVEYLVTPTSASGSCVGAPYVITVSVNPLPATPVITITGSDTICSGETAKLGTTKYSTYLWTNGGTTQTVKVLQQGNYYVTVTNSTGCSTTSNAVAITVKPSPTAAFTDTATGLTVSFNSSTSTGDVTSYSWDFGDGTGSTSANPKHTYTVNDTSYNVCLTVFNGTNCSYSVCNVVKVGLTGVASLSGGNKVNIYPDPASTYFIVTSDIPLQAIMINDVLGKRVMSMEIKNKESKINIASLPAGFYFVELKTEQSVSTLRLIKE